MKTYRASVVGCSRMGGFIDNEVAGSPTHLPPYSHAAGFTVGERTDLLACSDLRPDVMAAFGRQYDVPRERQCRYGSCAAASRLTRRAGARLRVVLREPGWLPKCIAPAGWRPCRTPPRRPKHEPSYCTLDALT